MPGLCRTGEPTLPVAGVLAAVLVALPLLPVPGPATAAATRALPALALLVLLGCGRTGGEVGGDQKLLLAGTPSLLGATPLLLG